MLLAGDEGLMAWHIAAQHDRPVVQHVGSHRSAFHQRSDTTAKQLAQDYSTLITVG